jgi:hypothetical protein
VFGAKQSNIRSSQAASAFGKWDVVIEMKSFHPIAETCEAQ